MKYFITILFFFNQSFCQTSSLEKELIKDFIENHTLKYGELRIVNNWQIKDSIIVKKDFEEKLTEFIKKKNDSIRITNEEKNKLIKLYIKSNISKWNNFDFENKIIEYDEALNYLKLNQDNTILAISHPIFFRDNTIALINYTNLCCGQVYGNTGLGFFIKKNGKWIECKMISQGSY